MNINNREYHYDKNSHTQRVEFSIIKRIIGSNKKVIDLGCGDGSLMQILEQNGNWCVGIEISQSGVGICRNRGLKATKGRIDEKLPFNDKSFDVAICNVTLHMVMYPEILISEMRRISKKQIITFPNFAFIVNRFQMMFGGIFPQWSLFGYKWYSTGHIHQLSIKDFENYCKENKINIINSYHLMPKPIRNSLQKITIIDSLFNKMSNLFATLAVFVTK